MSEIITSHSRMDLDGMAGLIAAKKLYPDAIPVRLRGMQTNVSQFLSLHKEHFQTTSLKDINFDDVTRVILVDLHDPQRIPELKKVFANPNLDIHVYDHHPQRNQLDPRISKAYIKDVGSTATVFINLFEQENISLTPEEANGLALGIYADTGNFTYLTTTQQDIFALAYLFKHGADIKVINHFIKIELDKIKKRILLDLLTFKDGLTYKMNGHTIIFAVEELDCYINGLSEIVMEFREIEDADASFVFFYDKDRKDVHVVARSKVNTIDVGRIMTRFGGGGQYAAAYAKVRKGDVSALRKKLFRLLTDEVKSKKIVRDAMISPVFQVSPNTHINELDTELKRRKIHGAPVVDDGKLIGIISIRDIDKARKSNLMHAPVKGYMKKQFVKVDPNATLEGAEELMLANNIGRLPVVVNGELIGIVTRTDILRHLYSNDK